MLDDHPKNRVDYLLSWDTMLHSCNILLYSFIACLLAWRTHWGVCISQETHTSHLPQPKRLPEDLTKVLSEQPRYTLECVSRARVCLLLEPNSGEKALMAGLFFSIIINAIIIVVIILTLTWILLYITIILHIILLYDNILCEIHRYIRTCCASFFSIRTAFSSSKICWIWLACNTLLCRFVWLVASSTAKSVHRCCKMATWLADESFWAAISIFSFSRSDNPAASCIRMHRVFYWFSFFDISFVTFSIPLYFAYLLLLLCKWQSENFAMDFCWLWNGSPTCLFTILEMIALLVPRLTIKSSLHNENNIVPQTVSAPAQWLHWSPRCSMYLICSSAKWKYAYTEKTRSAA